MSSLINLLAPLISSFLLTSFNLFPSRQPPNYARCVINFIAFLFSFCAYILGCIALYSYLNPVWGPPLSLFTLCIFLVTTSLVLVGIGRLITPKKPPSTDFVSIVEKTISQLADDKALSKILPTITPISLAAFVTVVAVAAYFVHSKKK